MTKVLVTGGAGFIGSHLVDKLISDDHEVIVIDSLEKQVHEKLPDYLNPRAEYYFGRFRDVPLLTILMDGIDYVFHCASKVGVAQSQSKIFEFVDKNINDTAYLFQKCIHSSVKKLILSASMAPYGEGAYTCETHGELAVSPRNEKDMVKKDFSCHCPICYQRFPKTYVPLHAVSKAPKNIPITEKWPFSSLSFYGITKRTQEELLHLFGRISGIKTIALRYFSVYGSRQAIGNPYAGPIPIFIDNAANNKKLIIFEDGQQSRDFIHVSDVAIANIMAMNSDCSQKSFNIATGNSTTIYELAKKICDILDSKSKIEINNSYRVGDIRHSLADISKAKAELGFKADVLLGKGMKETTNWYLEDRC